MRNLLLLVLVSTLLSGCVRTVYVPGEPLPESVVLLTTLYPGVGPRCTGIVVDPQLVLTMDHCVGDAKRLVTQRGQETAVEVVTRYPAIDVALLQPAESLYVTQFAEFREPERSEPVLVFGTCPWYFVHVPKRADYIGEYKNAEPFQSYHLQLWRVWGGNRVCGGDSGGPAVQNGYVVGLVHAVRAPSWFPAGTDMFMVPASDFQLLINDALAKYGEPAATMDKGVDNPRDDSRYIATRQ